MKKPYFFSRDGLSDEHYRLIGLIAAEWAEFELVMESALLHFLYNSWGDLSWRRSHCLSAEMGNVSRVNAILSLASVAEQWGKVTETQFLALEKLCNRADTLRGQRNEIVHATWMPRREGSTEPPHRSKMTAKRVLKVSLEPRDDKTLMAIAEGISQLNWEWRAFFKDVLRSKVF
ncbi:MAG TPA: hypothetical protein VD839_16120 [Burkholderiales bacterium]|nr:hypothetical protein [Burkholderiales bacterium]